MYLTDAVVDELLDLNEVVDAVRAAFQAGRPETDSVRVPFSWDTGELHLVAGLAVSSGERLACVKANLRRPGIVSGCLILWQESNGVIEAVMQTGRLTQLRTAALTALCVERLTADTPVVAAVLGAGKQASAHLDALASVRELTEVRVWSIEPSLSRDLRDARRDDIAVRVAESAQAAVAGADVIVTLTPATAPIVLSDWVDHKPLIMAIGSDAPGKNEIDLALLLRSRLVTDSLASCRLNGESQHLAPSSLESLWWGDVDRLLRSDPGELVQHSGPVIVDAVGTALQDGAAAGLALRRAREAGLGIHLNGRDGD